MLALGSSRAALLISPLALLALAAPALSDMQPISGAAPILAPGFASPKAANAPAQSPAASEMKPAESASKSVLLQREPPPPAPSPMSAPSLQILNSQVFKGPHIPGAAPVLPASFRPLNALDPEDDFPMLPPLVVRRRVRLDRNAELPLDYRDFIRKIEASYDPTRFDSLDFGLRFVVSGGTISALDLRGERWHIEDADANVNFRVDYIAQGWSNWRPRPCRQFTKQLLWEDGPETVDLPRRDCERIMNRRKQSDGDASGEYRLLPMALAVPVFATPFPGARFVATSFWTIQERRIAAIRAHLHAKWRAAHAQVDAAD